MRREGIMKNENAKTLITKKLNDFPSVRWDRFTEDGTYITAYGWIERTDGKSDFLLISFDDGVPWFWSTSSALHSKSFSTIMGLGADSTGHQDCQHIKEHFSTVVNFVKRNWRKFDALGQPVCPGCGELTNSAYAVHEYLPCWNCQAYFPPVKPEFVPGNVPPNNSAKFC